MYRPSIHAAGLLLAAVVSAQPEAPRDPLEQALGRAGDNRAELQRALDAAPPAQRDGMRFLIAHMPDRDLRALESTYLLENVAYAYRAWNEAPWKDRIPEPVFLNDLLPYACINERRDRWRRDFYERFREVVAAAKTPAAATAVLNQTIFKTVGVRYSTQRPKADQSPYESIEAGLASCTGLSVLLIDACRAVGVPARLAGTPLWSDRSGNHSWVEIWDDGWHFTGAAEPTGDAVDKGWFLERAAKAQRGHRRHAIFATSFRPTPLLFPMVWLRGNDYVHAVDVSDRYTSRGTAQPPGTVRVRFRVVEARGSARCAAALRVLDAAGEVVFEGTTKDERFDANDHLLAYLPPDRDYRVIVERDGKTRELAFRLIEDEQLVSLALRPDDPVVALASYLQSAADAGATIADQAFARTPLNKTQAEQAAALLWQHHEATIRTTRAVEMADRALRDGELEMRFAYQVFGDKPERGRSLYISLHGGGGTTARVNDRQWANQQRLYKPDEGVYLAPRAPTDTWNLWHQGHIDRLFDRLIENLIVFEGVDPNRVYVMGYSAGGDGVYQLAPRMADRWAAAAMMAGHPNDASPLGLRNIGFALYMGGRDAAYQRNEVARSWQKRLAALQQDDPQGYRHHVEIYEDKGHWMGGQDAAAVPWMAKFTRDPRPAVVVWQQDDVTHGRYYWLAVPDAARKAGARVTARRAGREINIDADGVGALTIRLDDTMLDLDAPLRIRAGDGVVFEGHATRSIATLARTLEERGDPSGMYPAEVTVDLR